jgi:hypothetical protein
MGTCHGNRLYLTRLLSFISCDGEFRGEYAAKISTPGALISGFIISGNRGFGPREEKLAILGALLS